MKRGEPQREGGLLSRPVAQRPGLSQFLTFSCPVTECSEGREPQAPELGRQYRKEEIPGDACIIWCRQYLRFGALTIHLWSADNQHRHRPEACQKCRIQGSSPDLQPGRAF